MSSSRNSSSWSYLAVQANGTWGCNKKCSSCLLPPTAWLHSSTFKSPTPCSKHFIYSLVGNNRGIPMGIRTQPVPLHLGVQVFPTGTRVPTCYGFTQGYASFMSSYFECEWSTTMRATKYVKQSCPTPLEARHHSPHPTLVLHRWLYRGCHPWQGQACSTGQDTTGRKWTGLIGNCANMEGPCDPCWRVTPHQRM